jgi:hypothetical protein
MILSDQNIIEANHLVETSSQTTILETIVKVMPWMISKIITKEDKMSLTQE